MMVDIPMHDKLTVARMGAWKQLSGLLLYAQSTFVLVQSYQNALLTCKIAAHYIGFHEIKSQFV